MPVLGLHVVSVPRFTRYFTKSGNKYYLQIIWTLFHNLTPKVKIFTLTSKRPNLKVRSRTYLVLFTIFSLITFKLAICELDRWEHPSWPFIKNNETSIWQPEITSYHLCDGCIFIFILQLSKIRLKCAKFQKYILISTKGSENFAFCVI